MKYASTTRPYSQGVRAQSSEETGRRIVEAFRARLLTQWYDEITLDRIAEDADVTVQTIVRRFGGKEGLLASAVKILASQIHAQRATPSKDLARLVENLIGDYEQTGDGIVRLLALEPRHPVLKQYLDFGRGQHRQWVTDAFATDLAKLDGARRERAIDALVIATDVFAWKILRRDLVRSIPASAKLIKSMIIAILADLSSRE